MLQESTVKDTLHLNKNSHIGYQTLARKFCAVNREFSDLLCLMNTLQNNDCNNQDTGPKFSWKVYKLSQGC